MKKLVLASFALASLVFAKPVFTVKVERDSAVYKCGEKAVFVVTASDDEGKPLPTEAKIRFTNDGRKLVKEETADFSKKATQKFEATMDVPSFLKMAVSAQYDNAEGKKVTAYKHGAAAFEPERIQAAKGEPKDFMAYWKGELAKADKEIPLDVKMEKMDNLSNDKHTTYKISFAAPGGRVYGFLCVPSTPGKKPAIVSVPGAGPGVLGPEVNDTFVSLVMNVHPYDTTTPGVSYKDQYNELNKNGVYMYHGGASRQNNFYHRPIIGIARAVEWLAKRDDVNAKRIGYHGSSQGGGFGLILGGLTHRFAAIVCNVPALCDHYGADLERNPGWPFYVHNFRGQENIDDMLPYYDAVNFARHIKVPTRIIVGFIDTTCSPSSVYSAYNALKSEDKKIINEIDMGHAIRGSYYESIKWMKEIITKE